MDAFFGSRLDSGPGFVDVFFDGSGQGGDHRAVAGADFFGYLMDSSPVTGGGSRKARFDYVYTEAVKLTSDFEFFFE